MTPAALQQLVNLAEARLNQDLARLEALLARERALTEAISDATSTFRKDMTAYGETLPFVQQGLRLAWADQCIAKARKEQAEVDTAITAARANARTSLGKHRALKHLLEKAALEDKLSRSARIEREAPPGMAGGAWDSL